MESIKLLLMNLFYIANKPIPILKFLVLTKTYIIFLHLYIGVALGDDFCHVESASIHDPMVWNFTVGMICNANICLPSLRKIC